MAAPFDNYKRCLEILRRRISREIEVIRTEVEDEFARIEAKEDILRSLEKLKNLGCLSEPAYERLKEYVERNIYLTLPDAIEIEILKACRST